MIESRNEEKCYYCENEGEYNQLVGEENNYVVASVCKKHFIMGLSS